MQNEPEAPKRTHNIIRAVLPRKLQPWARGMRRLFDPRRKSLEEPYRTVFPFTQASGRRQRQIVAAATRIQANGVPGALVECGVLDGGMSALMASAAGNDRELHLFDSWQGLPATTDEDGQASKKWEGQVVGSPARVRQVLRKVNVDLDRVTFHRGWFHETFPDAHIEPIAMLHIDCDFFQPTRLCLDRWFPHMSAGGYIQLDDYEVFAGCKKAVDQFLSEHPDLKLESEEKPGGAFFIWVPRS